MSDERFGWHKGDATVKLVPGAAKLPDSPEVVARQEEADRKAQEESDKGN